MRKTDIFCDDCKRKIEVPSHPLNDRRSGLNWGDGIDICRDCELVRLRQSVKDYPIGSMTCKTCDNKKKIQVRVSVNDSYEMRPEYETQVCQTCKDGVKLK